MSQQKSGSIPNTSGSKSNYGQNTPTKPMTPAEFQKYNLLQTAYYLKIFAVLAEMYAGFVTWAGYYGLYRQQNDGVFQNKDFVAPLVNPYKSALYMAVWDLFLFVYGIVDCMSYAGSIGPFMQYNF